MMTEFETTTEWHGGHLVGEFTCSYSQLVAIFGEPNCESDGYKVSTEWQVSDMQRRLHFTIYDYKETELYDSSLPTVAEFRALPKYAWHIGGTCKPDALIAFLRERIAALPAEVTVVPELPTLIDFLG